jgi:hypothetical protein
MPFQMLILPPMEIFDGEACYCHMLTWNGCHHNVVKTWSSGSMSLTRDDILGA